MEMQAKAELVGVIRERYVCASRKDKSRILDEFVAVTGHHRKHAGRLLSEPIRWYVNFGSRESHDQLINPNLFERGTTAHDSIHSKTIGRPFSNGYRRNLTLLHRKRPPAPVG